jgi:hypothetical protein
MFRPSQTHVLSLSEIMKTYGVYALTLNLETIRAYSQTLKLADDLAPALDTDRLLDVCVNILKHLKSACEEFGADSSLVSYIGTLTAKLEAGTADTRRPVLLAQIEFIVEGIHENLEKQHFLVLSKEEASFYINPNLFGESFKEKYSHRALRDAMGAGSCYAASQYTACVFHCMRVAEYGLRKLASNSTLRIKLTKNHRPCPIAYGTWQEVITAIQNKIKKIRQRPVGPKRESELQFFSSAADHCEYMKDIWRNEISHTRRWYKKEEALSVINRVKEFVIVVGEHKGSVPAEDSLIRLIERANSNAGDPPPPALPASFLSH